MSLHTLAHHMATAGRGPDSMLVHMSPREVQSLQALAEKNGGTLTINPHTGLPEAGFLDSLLPTLLGVGLSAFLGPEMMAIGNVFGGGAALGAGITVGGLDALATGSLSKGLMAGFGAYGGAGIAQGLANAGAVNLANEASAGTLTGVEGGDQFLQSTTPAPAPTPTPSFTGVEGGDQFLNTPPTPGSAEYLKLEAANNFTPPPTQAGSMVSTTTPLPSTVPPGDYSGPATQLSDYQGLNPIKQGIQSVNPLDFAKDNLRYIGAAAAPALLSQKQNTLSAPAQTPANIRRFSYDPYSGQYTSQGMYPATQDKNLASGGIAALADGGAVAFADGGVNAGATGAVQPAPVVLPTDWGVQGGKYDDPAEKIKYFNQNNITPDQLLAANQGVTQNDINWMLQNGYTGNTPAAGSNLYNQNVANWFTANPTATYADIVKAEDNYLKPEDIAASMKTAGMSGADIYAATHQNIGPTGNPNSGGLAGLNSNIQYWFNQHPGASLNDVRSEMSKWELSDADIKRAMGKTPEELTTGKITEVYNPAVGAGGNTGAGVVGGGTVVNPNGTVTTSPVIPGIPVGGFTGMQQVKDAYTTGGGSLGYVSPVVKNMDEFNTKYNKLSGDSAAMYDYLTGKSRVYPAATQNKELMRPYSEAVMGVQPAAGRPTQKYIFDKDTQTYKVNPDYTPVTYDTTGNRNTGLSLNAIKAALATPPVDISKWMTNNGVTLEQIAQALGISVTDAAALYGITAATKNTTATTGGVDNSYSGPIESGGQGGMKKGGMTQSYAGGGLGSLGGYSDGGQLLKGPGDGVSDSIPASIGDRQPARLADGEFVVPARIVSELGNGSTEAGARKLYQMMDRVQQARRKTTGKDRVATNSRSDKYLPA
jgi:hypothetical protein